jgi:putative oxidoreductase
MSGRNDDPMEQTRVDPIKQATKETAVVTPTARVTAARLAIREARPRRLTSLLLWAVQILLAALFLFVAAVPKLKGSQFEMEQFAHIGAGQWLRYFVGTAELAGAIGLLTPWLAGLAAAGLAADMAGATIINAVVLHSNPQYSGPWVMTGFLCAVFALIAYCRRQQIKALWAAIRR